MVLILHLCLYTLRRTWTLVSICVKVSDLDKVEEHKMSHNTRFSNTYADRQAFRGFTFCLRVFKSKVRNQNKSCSSTKQVTLEKGQKVKEPNHLPRRHPHWVRVGRELISRVNVIHRSPLWSMSLPVWQPVVWKPEAQGRAPTGVTVTTAIISFNVETKLLSDSGCSPKRLT